MHTGLQKHCSVYSGSLILVNARYPIREPVAENALVPADGVHISILLERRAAALLNRLMWEIRGWREILPVSGWRSQAEQQEIWDSSMRENGEAFTRNYVAFPGCSEHQTGLAIDLGKRQPHVDFIRPEFPDTGLCAVFRRQAAKYGYILRYPKGREKITGIAHEPWHFRYVGVPHAQIMMQLSLALEEYHGFIKQYPYEDTAYSFSCGARVFSLSYLPAQAKSLLHNLERAPAVMVSGNNMDGYIVTSWKERAA